MRRHCVVSTLALILVACGASTPSATPSSSGPASSATPTATATAVPTSPPPTPSASPTAQPTAAPTPTPATTPTPEAACLPLHGGTGARSAVTDVRVGTHTGYDRLVVEFDGPVPTWEMARNGSMTFTGGGKGEPMTLAGSAGVRLDLRGVDWMSDVYAHGTDLVPGYAVLREVRVVGDFEGVVNIGIGLSRATCPDVTVLGGPPRLVIDFPTN